MKNRNNTNYSKSFIQSDVVDRTVTDNVEKKSYKCKCKFFIRNYCLKRHLLTHMNAKVYRCDICSGTFYRSKLFEEHKTVHIGEKPFTCEIVSDRLNGKTA